jgi:sulfite exporter TauE/SafE
MNHLMPMCGSLSLVAAFLAGMAGSVHCLAMCGGLSGALVLRVRRSGASPGRTITHTVTYQLGRLASYGLAGALGGSVIGVVPALFEFQPLGLALRALAGLVLVAAAIGVLFTWRPLARIEQLGGRLWRHITPLTRNIPVDRIGGSFLLGMLWGWLPCGMVYSMVLVAALSGTPAKGAATMLCFGLGTLPAILSAGLAGAQLLRLSAGRRLNTVFGALLLVLGIMTVIAPWGMHTHMHM